MISSTSIQYSVAVPVAGDSISWNGWLTLSGGQGCLAYEAIEELFGYFARLANSGALASAAENLGNSGFAFKSRQSEGTLQIEFTAHHLHLGTWRILLQMLDHCQEMEPYQVLALASNGPLMESMGRNDLLKLAYPEPFDLPSVQLQLSDADFTSQDFILRVEFARQLSPEEFANISQLVDDWGSVVYTGGFTPVDQYIDEEILNKPNTYFLGQQAIEISVSGWAGVTQAISTLVNLVLSFSRKLPIVSIDLE